MPLAENALIQAALKGGPGSGHWGHAGGTGGPGNLGGSVASSVAMSLAGGKTAAIRQAIAKDLSKDIALVRMQDNGWLVVNSPYNEDFVQGLRDNIPSSMKQWGGGVWKIHPSMEDKARALVSKHYHTLDSNEFSERDRKSVVRAHEIMRVKDDQKYLRTHEGKMEARIQELETELNRASRRRKPDVLRRQALYTYALLDMRAKPESLQRVQRLSLAKVRGVLEGTRRDE